MRVLAADIGGTHARLALYEVEAKGEERPRPLRQETYRSGELEGPVEAIRLFLHGADVRPTAACFAIAAPTSGNVYRLPNLGWEVREAELSDALGISPVRVINDFEAVGRGLLHLQESELATLQAGRPRAQAPIAMLGPGTGLGTGYMTWHAGRYRVHSSEGGHADFAPRDALGQELQTWLASRHGRASWERVLSGAGLVDLYHFLRERREAVEREEMLQAIADDDPAEVISTHGLEGTDPLAVRALEEFVSYLGAQAGNLALTIRAEAGVYLAGGIAPAILPALRGPSFLDAFRAKGRLSAFMERIPVRVVLNTGVGLLGAAVVAVRS